MSDFGEKVKRIRKDRGMTQQEFADALGYAHKSTINKIESGQEDMSYEKLLMLVNRFSLDASELFEISNETWDQLEEALHLRKKQPRHEYCMIYIHGLHGSALEAEFYAFCGKHMDVIGLAYQDGDPWVVKDHIIEEFDKIASQYKGVIVVANSIGAFYAYRYLSQFKIEEAFFISPLVNMKKIIEKMMRKNHISLERLKQEQIIMLEDGQKLSYDFYMSLDEEDQWRVKTHILSGENDKLVDKDSLIHFLAAHQSTLTVMKNAGHYFHTPSQLRCIKKWIHEYL